MVNCHGDLGTKTLGHCVFDWSAVFAINRNFLYRVSLPDGAVEKITDQGGFPIVQSRDGRYLYFAQGRMDSTISRLDLSTRKQTIIVASVMPGYSDSWVVTSRGILFLKEESAPVIKFHCFMTGKETTIAEVSWGFPRWACPAFPSPRMNELYSWYARILYRQIFKQRVSQRNKALVCGKSDALRMHGLSAGKSWISPDKVWSAAGLQGKSLLQNGLSIS